MCRSCFFHSGSHCEPVGTFAKGYADSASACSVAGPNGSETFKKINSMAQTEIAFLVLALTCHTTPFVVFLTQMYLGGC